MSEKMTIHIKCKQVVEYSQYKEVSESDYNKLIELSDNECELSGKDFDFVQRFIDERDVLDAEQIYTDFSAEPDNDDTFTGEFDREFEDDED